MFTCRICGAEMEDEEFANDHVGEHTIAEFMKWLYGATVSS